MADYQLTTEQKIAQSYDRHLTVNANAGSGKTSVLVQRFMSIMLDDKKNYSAFAGGYNPKVKPNEVVAITFTRKAATELLSKVIHEIEGKVEKSNDSSELRYLRYVREKLTNARISTIHSFCSELLRSYPIEAEVSPNFTEMPPADLIKIKNETILKVFDEWLESKDDRAQRITELLNFQSKKTLTSAILALVGKTEIFDKLKIHYDKPIDEIIGERNNALFVLNDKIIKGFGLLNDILNHVDSDAVPKNQQGNYLQMYADNSKLSGTLSTLNKRDFAEVKSFISDFEGLLKQYYTDKGALKSVIFKNSLEIEFRNIAQQLFDSHFSDISDLNKALQYNYAEQKHIEYAKWIMELAEDVLRYVEEQKMKIDGLDFDDLMIKTKKLLENPEVAKSVQSKLKFLLVDEFQDTNDLQYDIVKLLVPDLVDNSIESGVNLFIVGDDKQSIYGFRNADVRVFNQARNDIKNLNKFLIEKGTIGSAINSSGQIINTQDDNISCGNVSLTSTFRLQPVVADFVNKICGRLMEKKETEYDVSYLNLTCAKNVDFILENPNLTVFPKGQKPAGSVSFLVSVSEQKKENEEPSEESPNEAQILAKFIRKSVDSDNPLMAFDVASGSRKITYRDIAILSRKKATLSTLARAFLAEGIPYVIHSGTGYFESQEILDIISYLNFLTNPGDDLAVSGLLKSSFFNLSDNELLILAKYKKDSSLWVNLENWWEANKEIENNDSNLMIRAFGLLNELKLYSSFLTVSQNILRLLEATGWYGTISREPARRQIEANIDKMMQFARDYESRGFRSLHDFVEHLNFILDADVNESEAVHLSDKNAVNIMTIHASKGLEFPLVVLYNTNSKSGKNESFTISKEFGINFSIPLVHEKKIWEMVDTPLYLISKLKKAKIESSEEKRLLYVAMTRAKDHLVISTNLKKIAVGYGKPAGLFALINSGFGLTLDAYVEKDTSLIENTLTVLNNNEKQDINIIYNADFIKKVDEVINPSEIAQSEVTEPLMLNAELIAESGVENFSATKLMYFQNDFDSYIKRYVLGFPDEVTSKAELKYDDSGNLVVEHDEIPASEIGSMIHNLMEQCGLWINPDSSVNQSKLQDLVDIQLSGNIDRDGKLHDSIFDNCLNVAETRLIKNELTNIISGRKEFQLQIPIGEDIIVAKMDLLLKSNNGNWEIWDWKTNRIDNPAKKLEKADHYQFQMKLYCYFLMLLEQEQ